MGSFNGSPFNRARNIPSAWLAEGEVEKTFMTDIVLTDVIVPNYVTLQSLPIVRECLESIRQHSHESRLIFVDNASPALDQIEPELSWHPNIVKILNKENLGFVKAVNQGLRASTSEYVVILNNDTVVCADWLPRLRAAFTSNVGIVGPRSQKNGTISGDLPWTSAHILGPGEMLCFFCVMISRTVLNQIGLLDEDFGIGLGDDDHYCWRAQQAGFDLCYLGDLTIFHHHKTTFKQLYTGDQISSMGWDAVDRIRDKVAGSAIIPQAIRNTRPSHVPRFNP